MVRLRQPRLAEIVAAELRMKIVSAEFPEASELPPFDALVEEFDVSPTSVRDALRILENEGLLTVRRGAVGGAVVHPPTPAGTAYLIGLVLQSRRVPVSDLSTALSDLLGFCAEMCARRVETVPDVADSLRDSHDRTLDSVDADSVTFAETTRDFHMTIVAQCGNASLLLVVCALEALWSGQPDAWPARLAGVETLDATLRQAGVTAHEEILAAILAGDAEASRELMRSHCIHPHTYGHAHQVDSLVSATQFGPTRSFRIDAPTRLSRTSEPTGAARRRPARNEAGQTGVG